MLESGFLTGSADSAQAYQQAIHTAAEAVIQAMPGRPYCGQTPAELATLLEEELCPAEGWGLPAVMERAEVVIANSVQVSHPHTAGHMHCAPLIPALAAEVVISALNQSMDSFDQAPAATVVEEAVVAWLCREAGLPAEAAGAFTAGGTQSNCMSLLLARDAYCHARLDWSVQERGLPPEARELRILCSEMAHFMVETAAAQLGLGTKAVVRVAVDERFRMCPRDLDARLRELESQSLRPLAVVATAGTTDFGSIDPLAEIATIARQWGAWLHVDAAYGGALLLSDHHRSRLAGIEAADSMGIDFHMLFWQPMSCGVFLLRDAAHFERIKQHADYLYPESHRLQGIPDLVTPSILTSRRFDALKLWICLQALGRKQFGAMVDHTLALAQFAGAAIRANSRLELLHAPETGCVVFRYQPEDPAADADRLNEAIRQRLFDTGAAVIGFTRVRGRSCLKLTLTNPCTTEADVQELLAQITECGRSLERGHSVRGGKVSFTAGRTD